MRYIVLLIIVITAFSNRVKAQNVKLELNLVKGKTYNQKLLSDGLNKQNVAEGLEDSGFRYFCKLHYKVIDIEDSVYNLQASYDSISITKSYPRGKGTLVNIGFPDSSAMKMDRPNDIQNNNSGIKGEKNITSMILSKIVNQPFLLRLSKKGIVMEVRNFDTVIDNAIKQTSKLRDQDKREEKKYFMDLFGEIGIRRNISNTIPVFPETIVTVGSKWRHIFPLEERLSGNKEITYELKENNAGAYLIISTYHYSTGDKDSNITFQGQRIKFSISGSGSSEFNIDKNSGWVIKSKTTDHGTGSIENNNDKNIPNTFISTFSTNTNIAVIE